MKGGSWIVGCVRVLRGRGGGVWMKSGKDSVRGVGSFEL